MFNHYNQDNLYRGFHGLDNLDRENFVAPYVVSVNLVNESSYTLSGRVNYIKHGLIFCFYQQLNPDKYLSVF